MYACKLWGDAKENVYRANTEARIVAYNLAAALSHLSKLHIMHRDIKPKNILVILDLGMSIPPTYGQSLKVTTKTPEFMLSDVATKSGGRLILKSIPQKLLGTQREISDMIQRVTAIGANDAFVKVHDFFASNADVRLRKQGTVSLRTELLR